MNKTLKTIVLFAGVLIIFFFIGNNQVWVECPDLFYVKVFCAAYPCFSPEPYFRMYTKPGNAYHFLIQSKVVQ